VWLESVGARRDRVAITKAREALAVAAARPAASSETLALYGRALFLTGNTDAAVRALEQAISRVPVEPIAYRYLSEAAAHTRNTALSQNAGVLYAALTEP
jgi:predicted Zn-dependent protease